MVQGKSTKGMELKTESRRNLWEVEGATARQTQLALG